MAAKKIAYTVRSLDRRWQRLNRMGLPGVDETHAVMLDIQDAHPQMRILTDNPMGHVKRRFDWLLNRRKSGDFAWAHELRRQGWSVEVPTLL